MPDTPLPTNEAPAPEQLANSRARLIVASADLSAIAETPEPPTTLKTLETSETSVGPDLSRPAPIDRPPEAPVEQEIEEELIIEDFTIDGICGVY